MTANTRLSDQYGTEPGLICIFVTVLLPYTIQAEHNGSLHKYYVAVSAFLVAVDREATLASEDTLYSIVGDAPLYTPTYCAVVHVGTVTPATLPPVTVRVLFCPRFRRGFPPPSRPYHVDFLSPPTSGRDPPVHKSSATPAPSPDQPTRVCVSISVASHGRHPPPVRLLLCRPHPLA
jgi:hypothetical protein